MVPISLSVLVDARESYRNKTGIGTLARNLCSRLEARFGYVCVPADYLRRSPPSSLHRNILQLAVNLIWHILWKQIYLPVKMVTSGSRVLFCPDPIGPLFVPGKVVLTVLDLMFFRYPDQVNRWWGIYCRLVLPFCLRRANRVIAISEATRQDLIEILGLNPAKVIVAHCGYDTNCFHPLTQPDLLQNVRMKYGLGEQFILFMGAIEQRRNIETLLQAVFRLRIESGLKLTIALGGGRTAYAEYLEVLIDELDLQEQIIWLGYVPDDDLPLLYSAAVMYVYPSITEGFGLTVLEAMACGCPVVCSNVDSLPEVAGEACILLPPNDVAGFADAIYRIWIDTALAQTMREKGLAQARRFSWDSMVETVARVCEEI